MSTQTPLVVLLRIAEENKLASDDFTRALSAVKVRSARLGVSALKLADGGGLTLYVPPAGAKAWRYRFRLAGREQTLSIGAHPDVSLEHARLAHRAARWLVARGVHPLQHVEAEIARQRAEEQARTLNSFGATMAAWMAATEAGLSVRTIKHRKAMLEKHVLPKLRDCPMADVTRKELRVLLVALDKTAPVTARHCWGYINQCFEWAGEEDLVENNPTPNARVLVYAGTRSVVPRKALPLKRLGDFLVTLEDAPVSDPLTKAALKLLILTWCRTSEVVGARWAEFDLDVGIWVIPAERMKADEPHRVFLSRQVVDLLRDLRPLAKSDVLFPNRRRPEASMHRMTLTNWRKRWGFADEMDVHGLRALASTWANESGRYRPDVIEVALAHREGDRVRAAYNRAQFVGELRALWQDWADHCDEKVAIARGNTLVSVESAAA